MSSSEQFPSGLNKWINSDKPARPDFVRDNEIIDQGAMWKSVYDNDGAVALEGGIPGYVGQQSQLTLGDAQSFTQDYIRAYNRAVATASNDALEITSETVRDEDWYDVQFVAPETFDAAKQVVIDGDIVSVYTSDGSAVSSGAWILDTVVTLTKKGNSAFFKSVVGNNSVYSTSETRTGERWIDGRPIYRKVVAVSRSSSTGVSALTDTTHALGLSGIAYGWIEMLKLADYDLPYASSQPSGILVGRLDPTFTSLILRSYGNWNARNGYVVVKYTKTSDPTS